MSCPLKTEGFILLYWLQDLVTAVDTGLTSWSCVLCKILWSICIVNFNFILNFFRITMTICFLLGSWYQIITLFSREVSPEIWVDTSGSSTFLKPHHAFYVTSTSLPQLARLDQNTCSLEFKINCHRDKTFKLKTYIISTKM